MDILIFFKIKDIFIFTVLHINFFIFPILNISCKMNEKMIQLVYR